MTIILTLLNGNWPSSQLNTLFGELYSGGYHENFVFRLSVYYPEIIVAKYHATAISFYDHAFGNALCKVRAKAFVICSSDSVSGVASVNLIFKPLQKKKKLSACYESCRFLQQAVSVVGVIVLLLVC
jgi:hypothetical protein